MLYLTTPPNADWLETVLRLLDMEPRDLMRKKELIYKELGLANPNSSRHELIEAMVQHPILIESPIVIADDRASLGRPPENVLNIL